ncbi:hypothetical protein [Parachlamydia acanthamoebae]|uniref:hypothetical protein n=1 Tax=Parachlamydia acanthamoebae TaxID=83552 RepID=UPI00075106A3|nr:hypothetical protein [Parachlamydia acanthamoebae]
MNTIQSLDCSRLADKFIDYATKGTNEFEGKPGFSEKVKEIIRAAAELKIGRTLLPELLESGKSITILEGKNDDLIGGNMLNPITSSISLNFAKKIFYTSINEDGERQIVEAPFVYSFLHEATHFKHWIMDPQALQRRLHADSSIPDMDNQEEELTITGSIVGADERDPFNDNAVLAELKLPPRIDHQSYILESPVEAIQEIILSRAIGSLRKILASPEGQKEVVDSAEILLPFIVEIILKCKSSSMLTEYAAIINLLISKGCKSDNALESLVRLIGEVKDLTIRKQYLEVIQQLITAGCKSDNALEPLVRLIEEVKDLTIRKQYLEVIQQLITAGCKSDNALKDATRQASMEIDPIRQKEWFGIIGQLIQVGCKAPNVLENIVGIIQQRTDDRMMQQNWAILIKPLIDETLDVIESKMVQEFCKNMNELISAGYAAIGLEFFNVDHEFHPNRELFVQQSQELQNQIEIINSFIEAECSLEDMATILKSDCSLMSNIKKFLHLDSLINGTLHVALCGKTFVQGLPGEFLIPQFKRIGEACESIIRLHRQKQDQTKKTLKLLVNLCLLDNIHV